MKQKQIEIVESTGSSWWNKLASGVRASATTLLHRFSTSEIVEGNATTLIRKPSSVSEIDVTVDLSELNSHLEAIKKSDDFARLFQELTKVDAKSLDEEEKKFQKQILLRQFATIVMEEVSPQLDTQGVLLDVSFAEQQGQFFEQIQELVKQLSREMEAEQIAVVQNLGQIALRAKNIIEHLDLSEPVKAQEAHLTTLAQQIAAAINQAQEDKDPLVLKLDNLLDLALEAKRAKDPETLRELILEIAQQCPEWIEERKSQYKKNSDALSPNDEQLKQRIDQTRAALSVTLNHPSIYVKGHELGAGGMGVVSKGYQPEGQKPVALKQIQFDKGVEYMVSGDSEVSAALKEATQTCPYLMKYYGTMAMRGSEAGKDGRLEVLEYLEGVISLSNRIKSQISVRDTLKAIAQGVEGAKALHQAGLVHRDIKPDNILIKPDGNAVLMDYEMICKENYNDKYSAGTIKYMSPEQASGKKAITSRSDVYSIGITLFEVFGGRADAHNYRQVVQFAKNNQYDVQKTTMPESLKPIVRRCLAFEPENRPEVDEILKAINQIIEEPAGDLSQPTYEGISAIEAQLLTPPIQPMRAQQNGAA
ncbi:protein kinase [Candidatus Peregrinibacteria bacterium]|nr:MAG: protein kinase [Candidatus Peregrinibacteria bacterium]